MKNTKLAISLILAFSINASFGCAFKEGPKTLEAYFQSMDEQKLPRVLIVGCGHLNLNQDSTGEDHSHENHWCVNIANPDDYEPYKTGYDASNIYWKIVGADAQMDIAGPFGHLGSQASFDVVVLERNWPKPLNDPFTLFNASCNLKPGGQLIVDVHSTYNYRLYGAGIPGPYNDDNKNLFLQYVMSKETKKSLKLSPEKWEEVERYSEEKKLNILLREKSDPLLQLLINKTLAKRGRQPSLETLTADAEKLGLPLDSDVLNTLLTSLGIKDGKEFHVAGELIPMAEYLSNWGFTSILPVKDAMQPYCKGRKGHLLVATKSATHDAKMIKEWRQLLTSYNRENLPKPASIEDLKRGGVHRAIENESKEGGISGESHYYGYYHWVRPQD